ncbi:hypothetical protein [Aestuariispira ectoiniformans]|uniref:hypothetical protein n=1 Tax=Aestuariispira ectoiniformans TaxID=2775080 RepID=UPI00223AC86A|nr:hypothetical protein [Aestuariispira ectoiniformans]
MDFYLNLEKISIHFEMLEVDENDTNSIRFQVNVKLDHSTGSFSYSANDIWIDTEMWDAFERQVSQNLEEAARFYDQSNYFEIHLTKDYQNIYFVLIAKEPLVPKGQIALESEQKLDIDGPFIEELRESLKSFPKFW